MGEARKDALKLDFDRRLIVSGENAKQNLEFKLLVKGGLIILRGF